MAGTSDVHGKNLGAEECRLTKQAIGLPEDKTFLFLKQSNPFLKNTPLI